MPMLKSMDFTTANMDAACKAVEAGSTGKVVVEIASARLLLPLRSIVATVEQFVHDSATNATVRPGTYFVEQVFVPVSATLAIIHFPSTRTMSNKSVPQ